MPSQPVAVAVEVTVGKVDAGALGGELGEGDLDLGGAVRVGFDLHRVLMSQLKQTRRGGS